MIEQAIFTYSPLVKAFEKKAKIFKFKGKKAEALQSLILKQQLKSIEDLFPENLLNTKAKDEIDKVRTIEKEIIRDDLIYKAGNKKR